METKRGRAGAIVLIHDLECVFGLWFATFNTYHRASKVMPFEMPLTSKNKLNASVGAKRWFCSALLVRGQLEVGHFGIRNARRQRKDNGKHDNQKEMFLVFIIYLLGFGYLRDLDVNPFIDGAFALVVYHTDLPHFQCISHMSAASACRSSPTISTVPNLLDSFRQKMILVRIKSGIWKLRHAAGF